jgi:putative DNA primase/helicase
MRADDYDAKVRRLESAGRPRLRARNRASSNDWRANLARSATGYLGDERNVLMALRSAPELIRLTRFNEFSLSIEFTRSPPWRTVETDAPWTEQDDTQLLVWLQTHELRVRNSGVVASCVAVAARDHSHHPVRSYLTGLQWDGQGRLSSWAANYLSAAGSPEYLSAVGMRFLVSAVARILKPGCQADHVLVLEGGQGIGKTSAARALAVRPEWFAGSLPDIHSKDAPIQLCGRWIIEIAELKAIRTSQIEATKSFLTETIDTFRPPYGRHSAQFPRQCVFVATTNESEYLRDRSGNRRFWPVKCRKIDVSGLVRDRDQLYAEAVHLYHAGTAWHLTGAELHAASQEQNRRVYVSELEQDVREYLDGQKDRDEITVREVLVYALALEPDNQSYTEGARKLGPAVAEALERCGWEKNSRRGKERRTTYRRRQG